MKNRKLSKNDFFKKLILKVYHDEFWLRNVPQHLKSLFLVVRTHPMKNSSNINFLKNRLFWYFSNLTCHVKLFLENQRKNYHLKVLPTNSWDFLDVFCTINEYTTTPRSKYTFCQSTLILLENSGFFNCEICVAIFKQN